MSDFIGLPAHALREKLIRREVTAVEIAELYLKRAEQFDGKVKGYLRLSRETALAAARTVDEKIAKNAPVGLLAGVPIAIKDNISIKGDLTTCASRILENYVAPYDATVIEKIKREDGVVIGKTNMDEFAMGSSTENSHFGTTRNPWDLERVPGGSSGGSAAVVSAREAVMALGSDTGGSIRQPAALCGVVGLKPTYGSVSRYGLVAFASSLDQIGPITYDVQDAALMQKVIGGHDRRDSTSIAKEVPDYTQSLVRGVKGLKFGLPKEYLKGGLEPAVEKSMQEAIEVYQKLGAEMVDISLPHTDYAIATYYIIATAEASANLARYDGVKYGFRAAKEPGAAKQDLIEMYEQTRSQGFGPEVKRRIILGTYVLSSGYYDAYYLKAQRVRTLLKRDFDEAFRKCDCIITPTSPTCAFKVGEKSDDPLQMYLSDIFTISVNLAGIPAISIPCGFSDKKLPVGLQIMGKHFDEETVLRAAYAFEQNSEFCNTMPGWLK